MADNELVVTSAGPALSLLFYENIRNPGDQIGLLVGEVIRFSSKNVTDAAERQVDSVKTHVDIRSVMPCSIIDLLDNPCGKINKTKLKALVGNKEKNIIGWYRYRMNSGLQPTPRDKIIHKQLIDYFYTLSNINENYFVLCMLNYLQADNRSIHKFRHLFLRYHNKSFQPVSLHINNLGNDASKLDDYKPSPEKLLNDENDFFTQYVDTLRLNLSTISGTEAAKTILEKSDACLTKKIRQLSEEDKEVNQLMCQVDDLRNKIRQLENYKFNRRINQDMNRSQKLPSLINEMNINHSIKDEKTDSNLRNDNRRSNVANRRSTHSNSPTY